MKETNIKLCYANVLLLYPFPVDPLCSCGNDIESTVYSFFHCTNFTTQRQTLLNKLKSNNASILAKSENSVVQTFLFERPDFTDSTDCMFLSCHYAFQSESTLYICLNKKIINANISFILTTEPFNCPLFLKLSNSPKSEALQSPHYIFSF